MKQVLIIFTLICLLAGCGDGGATGSVATSQEPSPMPTSTTTGQTKDADEEISNIPQQLIFHDYKSFIELSEINNYDDEKLMEYLDAYDFSMNGLRTRNDVSKLIGAFGKISFPIKKDLDASEIIVYPERDEIFILFEPTEDVTNTFRISMKPNSANSAIQSMRATGVLPRMASSSDGNTDVYSHNENNNDGADSQVKNFIINADGTYIIARVFNTSDMNFATNSLCAFDFVDYATLQNAY
jgi:hypothetical protein